MAQQETTNAEFRKPGAEDSIDAMIQDLKLDPSASEGVVPRTDTTDSAVVEALRYHMQQLLDLHEERIRVTITKVAGTYFQQCQGVIQQLHASTAANAKVDLANLKVDADKQVRPPMPPDASPLIFLDSTTEPYSPHALVPDANYSPVLPVTQENEASPVPQQAGAQKASPSLPAFNQDVITEQNARQNNEVTFGLADSIMSTSGAGFYSRSGTANNLSLSGTGTNFYASQGARATQGAHLANMGSNSNNLGKKKLALRAARVCSRDSTPGQIKNGSIIHKGDLFQHFKGGVMQTDFKKVAALIVGSRQFEAAVATLILLNAVSIGYQIDWRMKNVGVDGPDEFRAIDLCFTFGFALEICFRLFAARGQFFSFKHKDFGWNIFDLVLVVAAFIEEILTVVTEQSINLSAMQFLRIMRLVKVLRIVRVMRVFNDLRKMVTGILGALRSLAWCLLLLLLIMYTFSVCMMQVAADELSKNKKEDLEWVDDMTLSQSTISEIQRFFGSLIQSIFTLFQAIVGGVDWHEATTPLIDIQPLLGLLFVIYISFAVFCVLNIVTGVFVEKANAITQRNDTSAIMDELAIRQMWQDEVQTVFESADADGSGELEWDEFERCLGKPQIQDYFKRIGLNNLDREGLSALFQLLDFDGNGTIGMSEFVEGCTHVHGYARSLDIVRLRHENRKLMSRLDDLQGLVATSEQRAFEQRWAWDPVGQPTEASAPFQLPGMVPQYDRNNFLSNAS